MLNVGLRPCLLEPSVFTVTISHELYSRLCWYAGWRDLETLYYIVLELRPQSGAKGLSGRRIAIGPVAQVLRRTVLLALKD